mmetsp:Transcript_21255/g.49017  ORF Transcript_21255/g.49017 Transcript_21255/m.49017 type:complete len:224 (-) Transcript_21255:12-683(-)
MERLKDVPLMARPPHAPLLPQSSSLFLISRSFWNNLVLYRYFFVCLDPFSLVETSISACLSFLLPLLLVAHNMCASNHRLAPPSTIMLQLLVQVPVCRWQFVLIPFLVQVFSFLHPCQPMSESVFMFHRPTCIVGFQFTMDFTSKSSQSVACTSDKIECRGGLKPAQARLFSVSRWGGNHHNTAVKIGGSCACVISRERPQRGVWSLSVVVVLVLSLLLLVVW